MLQTIVVVNGIKTEQDAGDYFPLWLRNFVTAVFDPVPDTKSWDASAHLDQIIMPNGDKSDACARDTAPIGNGQSASTSFSKVCFDSEHHLKFVGSPRYSMSFSNYASFGKIKFPRTFSDSPEPGTALTGAITQLEKLTKSKFSADLFKPLPSRDARFDSRQVTSTKLDELGLATRTIQWPSVYSGVTRGHVAMYVSVDTTGQIREAWPLASDNAGLEDPARAQVMTWKLTPVQGLNGTPVQFDGGVSFSFTTTIEDPLPELSSAEIRKLAIRAVEPLWPSQGVESGKIITLRISVNERGDITGFNYGNAPASAQGPLMNAIRQWHFTPLIRNGKPQYFHGTLDFVAP